MPNQHLSRKQAVKRCFASHASAHAKGHGGVWIADAFLPGSDRPTAAAAAAAVAAATTAAAAAAASVVRVYELVCLVSGVERFR